MTFMSTTGQTPGPPVPPVGASGSTGPLRMTPGRWLALAIGVPVALALIGWTAYSLVASVARGSYAFGYTFPVRNGQVALNINAGDITLHQAPAGDAARLTGTVQYGLVRPNLREFTTPTSANISLNCSANIAGNCGVNAHLDVPVQTGVTLWSNGGDVTASGFSSGMTLWTDGGNVNVSNLAGALQLETGGGDLTANGLTGTLVVDTQGGNVNAGNWTEPGTGTMRLNTDGGDITVNGLTGNFQLVTTGGNVNASDVTAAMSTTQSEGGDVTLAFGQVPKDVTITALGGNVTVILPPGGTKYDISTPDNQGGNIDIPSSLVASNSPDKITIDSGGGDITVSQG